MKPGTHVEVRNRFEQRWTRGFEIAEVVDAGSDERRFRLRRRSDGSILPVLFEDEDVREERRRQGWWM